MGDSDDDLDVHPGEEAEEEDERSKVNIRNATVDDMGDIREVLEESWPVTYDDAFYKQLRTAIRDGKYPNVSGRLSCMVAEAEVQEEVHAADEASDAAAVLRTRRMCIGVIVANSVVLAEEREASRLTFDLLQSGTPHSQGVNIMFIAVLHEFRRLHIGHDLMMDGVSALAGKDAAVHVCFAYTPIVDHIASAFMKSIYFTKMGVMKGHFVVKDKPTDAYVWGFQLHDHTLAEYRNSSNSEEPVDLSSPEEVAKYRVHPTPRWLRDLLLHYLLPFGAVLLLFLICYLLVVFGPLKGISGPPPPDAPLAGGAHLTPDGRATGADDSFHEEL